MGTDWSGDELLRPEGRRHLERMQPKDEDGEGTAVAFGRVGARPALTVRFCPRAGESVSFAYAHHYSTHADGKGRLLLTFTGHTVTIEGRNLHRLHDYLDAHRATRVRETELTQAEFLPDSAEVVERIVIERAEG